MTVPERRPPPELLGPASFFPGEAAELLEDTERPPKLPEGFAEGLARELSELRAGSLGDIDMPEETEETKEAEEAEEEDLEVEAKLGLEQEEDDERDRVVACSE